MTSPMDDREKRLVELKKEVTKRGFNRHASIVGRISDLPIDLRSSALEALAAGKVVQTVIVFPPQIQRGWHYIPKQALVFTDTSAIHLLASILPEQEPQVTYLRGCGLMYMKITLVLLYGFLEMAAQGEDFPTRLAMEFNTISWDCLASPLRQLLQKTQAVPGILPGRGEAGSSSTVWKSLEKLPIKFSNGAKIYGVLPGEELEEVIFQEAAWKRWLYFFQRPASANTLLLLTSNYLVVIQEEIVVKQGWVVSYIPRGNITCIQNKPCGCWNELSVQLKRGNQLIDYKLMLASETVETWHSRWAQHGGLWQDLPAQQI